MSISVTKNEPTQLIRDIRNAIIDDEYMWLCIWGGPRKGKSTLALLISYWIYGDWEKVLNAIGFNLGQILYKIKRGIPEQRWTYNNLHNRIPILLWDDFGAYSNKAVTQHLQSWDIFKGGFDVLGTKIGVLMATMLKPTEPTQQLFEKYTHEIWIRERGLYKYDVWNEQQDFNGFLPKGRKDWIEQERFLTVPDDVFRRYDEMRQALADEVIQNIEDTIVDNETERIRKRLEDIDVDFMKMIKDRGQISVYMANKEFGEQAKLILTRLKARSIIIPISIGTHMEYDLSNFGLEVLRAIETPTVAGIAPVGIISVIPPVSVSLKNEQQGSFNSLLASMTAKKMVAQSFQFQGLRITESYGDTEPDIVVWKDATTPSEVVSVKIVSDRRKMNIAEECEKEKVFAEKFGFNKIHLIVFDAQNNKVLDDLVAFDQTVDLAQPKAQEGFKVDVQG